MLVVALEFLDRVRLIQDDLKKLEKIVSRRGDKGKLAPLNIPSLGTTSSSRAA